MFCAPLPIIVTDVGDFIGIYNTFNSDAREASIEIAIVVTVGCDQLAVTVHSLELMLQHVDDSIRVSFVLVSSVSPISRVKAIFVNVCK